MLHKKKFIKSAVFLLLFGLLNLQAFSQEMALFEEGNALYNAAKYEEAIAKYTAILNADKHSAELYFNLGNAHYKLNNIAPSIYYYEKALQLAPNDPDIKQNRAFAQNMTIDAIDVIPEVGIAKVINKVSHFISFDAWAVLAVCFVVLAVVSFINYYITRGTKTKRVSFTVGFIALFLVAASLVSAFNKYSLDQADNPAIVFAQESPVKNEPNLRSAEAFVLHEGTKVQVLDTVEDWKKIKLTDGKTGWILADDIKLLR
ncbi:tetratricopeptide repeat protein [Bizionia sediminis]|uniref:Tetratricopeptide repeat protein n=1 Tax=Bizionia sediminis TaxID=1737064 RepID=A0ABW5KSI2_9FLAO